MKTLITILCLLLFLPSNAQENTGLREQLIKRYGNATPWAMGYIVKANGYLGFCNHDGNLTVPIACHKVDTLLNDRALFHYASGRCVLTDGQGKVLNYQHCSYTVTSQARRILASPWGLCNDRGEIIGGTYNQGMGATERVVYQKQNLKNGRITYGVMTAACDTLLPAVFDRIVLREKALACMRNDTAFVFDLNGRRLSFFPQVDDCNLLATNRVVLRKYGTSALASIEGKLLTGFHYRGISDFRYSPVTVKDQQDQRGVSPQPAVHEAYIAVYHHATGLIDTNGKVVVPVSCRQIEMNSNGWILIDRYDRAELLDEKLDVKFRQTGSMHFLDQRYVMAYDPAGYGANETFYDMVTRQVLDKRPQSPKENRIQRIQIDTMPRYWALQASRTNQWRGDTLYFNLAGTKGFRRAHGYGMISLTGDTILPFVYDTIYNHEFQSPIVSYPALVRLKDKYGYLDHEGKPATPVIFPGTMRWILPAEQIAITHSLTVYSYKDGTVKRIDTDKEPVLEPSSFFKHGVVCVSHNSTLRPGIYNRSLKKIAPYDNNFSCSAVSDWGHITAIDSARGHMSIVDSTGRVIVPQRPRNRLMIQRHYAVLIDQTGSRDTLYRFEKNPSLVIPIRIDTQNVYFHNGRRIKYSPFLFHTQSGETGLAGFEKAFIMKDVDELKPEYLYKIHETRSPGGGHGANSKVQSSKEGVDFVLFRKKNRWGMCNENGEILLPAAYDSIRAEKQINNYPARRSECFRIYKAGKTGVYNGAAKKTIEPQFDTVLDPASLSEHFLITRSKNGIYKIVDEDNRTLSQGWDSLKYNKREQHLCGIHASRNGRPYKLFPSVKEGLETIPVAPELGAVTVVSEFLNGWYLLRKDSFTGVYDPQNKSWKIPPVHSKVESEEKGYFIGYDSGDHGITLYNDTGKKLFSKKGSYPEIRRGIGEQWHLTGYRRGPVVNASGRVIIPDTVFEVESIRTPARAIYKVAYWSGAQALIDTSGKLISPLDGDQNLYDHIFTVGKNKGFVDSKGNMLLFNDIRMCYAGDTIRYLEGKTLSVKATGGGYRADMYVVSKGKPEKYGLMDASGRLLIPCEYDRVHHILPGDLVAVRKGKKWALVDRENRPLTGFIYDALGEEELNYMGDW